jgi:hypothetical protein
MAAAFPRAPALVALDGGEELQMLPHAELGPQHVKLQGPATVHSSNSRHACIWEHDVGKLLVQCRQKETGYQTTEQGRSQNAGMPVGTRPASRGWRPCRASPPGRQGARRAGGRWHRPRWQAAGLQADKVWLLVRCVLRVRHWCPSSHTHATDPELSAKPLAAHSPVSTLMVVVLPAPLWPSRAVIWPRGMSRLRPSTATCKHATDSQDIGACCSTITT